MEVKQVFSYYKEETGVTVYAVYELVDPRDNTIRYVGISGDVYKRFIQHINCTSDNAPKNSWIAELKRLNLMVIMRTLETTETYEEALSRETEWIHRYQLAGETLFNKVKVIPAYRTWEVMPGSGRKSTYASVREVVLHYHTTGHWPDGVSDDMKRWYRLNYFTKPNKRRDGAKYEKHKRSYERGRQWIEAIGEPTGLQ